MQGTEEQLHLKARECVYISSYICDSKGPVPDEKSLPKLFPCSQQNVVQGVKEQLHLIHGRGTVY